MGQRFSEPLRGRAWRGVVEALRKYDPGAVAYPGIIVTGEQPGEVHTRRPGFYPRFRIGDVVGNIGSMLHPAHPRVEADGVTSVLSAGEDDPRQIVVRSTSRRIVVRKVHPEVLKTAVAEISAHYLSKNALRAQIEFARREIDMSDVDGNLVLRRSLSEEPLYMTRVMFFLEKIRLQMRPGVTAEQVRATLRRTHVGLDTMMVGLLGADDGERRYVAVGEDRRGYTVVEIVPRLASLPVARCFRRLSNAGGWLEQEPVGLWWGQVSA